MKTVLAWTLLILAVVGIGVGGEAAVGVGRPAQVRPAIGTVTGVFLRSGGSAVTSGVSGTVDLYSPTACTLGPIVSCKGVPVAVTESVAGHFSISAPAGHYSLVGTAGGNTTGVLVTVTADRTIHAEVVFDEA